MNRIKKAFLHWLLGEYIVEVQAIRMVPHASKKLDEFMYLMHEIVSELKLLRITGPG